MLQIETVQREADESQQAINPQLCVCAARRLALSLRQPVVL